MLHTELGLRKSEIIRVIFTSGVGVQVVVRSAAERYVQV